MDTLEKLHKEFQTNILFVLHNNILQHFYTVKYSICTRAMHIYLQEI